MKGKVYMRIPEAPEPSRHFEVVKQSGLSLDGALKSLLGRCLSLNHGSRFFRDSGDNKIDLHPPVDVEITGVYGLECSWELGIVGVGRLAKD
jgi:hypothetical protein